MAAPQVPPAPQQSPSVCPFGRTWGPCLLLTALLFLAYANTLQVPLLFDDEPSIAKNESIRHLSTAFLPPQNGAPVSGRPMLNASFALNYALAGLSLPGFHVTNLLIHALAALALFGLIRHTLARPGFNQPLAGSATTIAWFVAAIWALHPLQTESVTYTAQRAESLTGLFYLFTLYAFVRSTENDARYGWRWLAWLGCLGGMATKEVMATAPVIVLLYDRTFLNGSFREAWRRNGRLHLALASTWLALGYLMVTNDARSGTIGFAGDVTCWNYLCTQSYALSRYLLLFVFPGSLVFDYGTLIVKDTSTIVVCGSLVGLLLAATIAALRKSPRAGFVAGWFFIVLAPTSSVIPIITQTMAEHRMYLPLASLATATVLLLWQAPRKIRYVSLSALVLAAGLVTWQRNRTYQTETAIWADAVAKRPDNPRALNNLGLLFIKQKRYPEAIERLSQVLAIDPKSTEANYNLGYALTRLDRDAEAIKYFGDALAAKADNTDALVNCAAALLRLGRIEESITRNEAALRLNPKLAEAHYNLGVAQIKNGKPAEGVVHLKAAARLAPDDADYFRIYVSELGNLNQPEEAIAACEARLQQTPSADLYTFLGVLYARTDHLEKARDAFLAALKINPDHEGAAKNLARANALLQSREMNAP